MQDPNAKADFLGGVLSNVPTPASVFVSVMVVIGEACVLRLASVVDGSDVLCALVCSCRLLRWRWSGSDRALVSLCGDHGGDLPYL